MNSCFKGKFRVTSGYMTADRPNHYGIDLVGVDDTAVYAPCDGVIGTSTIITNKSNKTWEWGNYVRLDTADGTYSIYLCHLASRLVTKGQKVKKGDKLGIMGNTGYSFGAHTHFEVRYYGTSTKADPAKFIGIPNAVGVYEAKEETKRTLAENLSILQKESVINTPQYWLNTVPKVPYLEELIDNFVKKLKAEAM